ncbi:uncharacterized protein METZ01_LOCUS164991 [marine metagenome]|uniref:Uncharacterized protein n=1 Tax=marine metagenome TaxID=408172 RepID=A0A382BG27_9ZZZZ
MSYLRGLRGCKAPVLRILNFAFHFSKALMAGHRSNLLGAGYPVPAGHLAVALLRPLAG